MVLSFSSLWSSLSAGDMFIPLTGSLDCRRRRWPRLSSSLDTRFVSPVAMAKLKKEGIRSALRLITERH